MQRDVTPIQHLSEHVAQTSVPARTREHVSKTGGPRAARETIPSAGHCLGNQKYESSIAILKGHTDEQTRARDVRLAHALDSLPPHPSATGELKNSARGQASRLLFFCFARTKLTETWDLCGYGNGPRHQGEPSARP